jgi:hypothetical protein
MQSSRLYIRPGVCPAGACWEAEAPGRDVNEKLPLESERSVQPGARGVAYRRKDSVSEDRRSHAEIVATRRQ